jgi:DNA-binding beta-propeller fold protein YncE
MKRILLVLTLFSAAWPVLAQRPSIPPQAIAGPDLGHRPVAIDAAFDLPEGMAFASVAAVEIGADGHVFVLHRADPPILEFDADGKFIRAFGDGLFRRSHGLRIDEEGFFWATDFTDHIVMKLDRDGNVLMTLGTRGESGAWDEEAGTRLFNQPNDVAIASDGSIFVAQGHVPGTDPRILKFDRDGNFIKSWGGRGALPWQFEVAHTVVIDDEDQVYVGDREGRRILVFDLDGNFLKGWVYQGMACALYLRDGSIYMATGFDGQIVKLDMDGRVLGVTGRPGEGLNEYGEAHYLAVSENEEIYVADVLNRTVQKLVP